MNKKNVQYSHICYTLDMDNMRKLEEIFGHFPGIGPRQAKRFVYYLLNKSPSAIKEFIDTIQEAKKGTAECDRCHRLFLRKDLANKATSCSICLDSSRDQTTLMIVERNSDFESIERSGAYKGLYFILGGTVPILDKEPEKRIRIKTLLERISASLALKEIILSMNTTPDGEHTETIVRDAISRIETRAKVSELGRGLSTGAELEYVDGETIRNALSNRK